MQDCEIYFFDLQGFKSKNNSFIVKELCLLSEKNDEMHLLIINPPFAYENLSSQYKKQVIWLGQNFHGFNWGDGFISYQNARKILLKKLEKPNISKLVFIKGEEKKMWAQKILQNNKFDISVFNIEEFGLNNSATDIDEHCTYHHSKFVCAYKNVIHMKKWFRQNDSEINL